MKNYPTLYARSSTGAVLEWRMEQDKDKYRTISGTQSGQKVTSEWTDAESKNVGRANETTAEKQATSEIEAKYKKQLKSGGYWENLKDIDKELYIAPMLAKKFLERLDKITYPVIVDRKFNGSRLITQKSGQFTRKGEVYKSIPHLFEALQPLFKKYPNLVLDGEAYSHEYRFNLNEIMKLVRSTVHITSQDLAESKAKIKYYVYDSYGHDDITEDTLQFPRRKAMVELLKDIPFIVPVAGKVANNEEEVYKIFNEYLEDGYEGAIIRLNGKYEHKRSANLLKLKPEMDAEGIIIDIIEGEGNWRGTGKVITLKWNGVQFNATLKSSYENAVQFLKDKDKWIGKEVTFLYNDITGLGIPNFARVDYLNCVKS